MRLFDLMVSLNDTRSQPVQVERPELIPGIPQRGVPLVAPDAAKVGWAKGPNQIADLVAGQHRRRDHHAAHLTRPISCSILIPEPVLSEAEGRVCTSKKNRS
jgi:hypothetical protein